MKYIFKTAVLILSATLAGCGSGVEVAGNSTTPPSNDSPGSNTGGGSPTVGTNNPQASSGAVSLDDAHRYASRFLTQATFGPTEQSIEEFINLGPEGWLEQQFTLPASEISTYTQANSNGSNQAARHQAWWNNALSGQDQLRQRVAFALSQLFVISDRDFVLANRQYGVASYYDMLSQNAFGNYRELLEQVTLHPVMGVYLTHARSERANAALNIRPDENYAREALQLFSTGLNQLTLGGETVLNNGRPIPVYSQLTVEEFARIYTGWNYATARSWTSTNLNNTDYIQPMVPDERYHDTGAKTLLDGAVVPAGQTARQDLEAALDNIFNHSNVAPFVSKFLIQRLVTSNPSSNYVARVATVFNNNGNGVKGDLQAVITALLLDPEARNEPIENPTYGKVKEPNIKLAHFFRALNGTPGPDANGIHRTASFSLERLEEMMGQAPLRSPSVFNFYQADTPISPTEDLVAPEMQITTEANVASTHINFHHQIYRFSDRATLLDDNTRVTIIDTAPLVELAGNTTDLLDWIDLIFFSGSMPDYVRDNIQVTINAIGNNDAGRFARVQDALFMAVSSPAFSHQR